MFRSGRLIRVTTISAAALLAVLWAVVVFWGARPAEAAFPGANGKIVFQSNRTSGPGVDNPTEDFELFMMNPDGTGVTQLTHNTADEYNPAVSADGQQIAFASYRDVNHFTEIYVMNAAPESATNPAVRLTNNTASDGHPAWSPSEVNKIAFVSNREDDIAQIYIMDTDPSTDDATRLTNYTTNADGTPADDLNPAWSPDGARIAFSSRREDAQGTTDSEIYTMRATDSDNDGNGDNLTRLTNNSVFDSEPSWSPNGRKIAFVKDVTVSFAFYNDIFVMNRNGSEKKRLTKNQTYDESPAFSPDGRKIAFARLVAGDWRIFVMNSDGTRQRSRTKAGEGGGYPDWQPIVP